MTNRTDNLRPGDDGYMEALKIELKPTAVPHEESTMNIAVKWSMFPLPINQEDLKDDETTDRATRETETPIHGEGQV